MRKNRILKCIGVFILTAAISLFIYRRYNLTYDYTGSKFMDKEGRKAGFTEKQAVTPDGNTINYAEGPKSGPPLLLIHGQMVDWKDYGNVLPELSKEYHIFAADCYGHGKSEKKPELYNISAITKDLLWFSDNVIKEPFIVSGHSSGALIASNIAARSDKVTGAVLEDGPFFTTQKGRIENTFSYLDFKTINSYLQQKEIKNYTEYSLKNSAMKAVFNKDGKDNWKFIVEDPALKILSKNPGKLPYIWYYPPSLGINKIIALTANLQDGTGDYDLRFGQNFFNLIWQKGYREEEVLKKIKCPAYILHVAPSNETAPSYYTSDGILLSAMDEKDAKKVSELIKGSKLIEGFKSSHDIHADLPEEFLKVMIDFKKEYFPENQ